jgi:hypothetical protein
VILLHNLYCPRKVILLHNLYCPRKVTLWRLWKSYNLKLTAFFATSNPIGWKRSKPVFIISFNIHDIVYVTCSVVSSGRL